MAQKKKLNTSPQSGWVLYLRTSSLDAQNPKSSQDRQRFNIGQRLLNNSSLPLLGEYVDTESGKRPDRRQYQQMLTDARAGKFSFIGIENAERFGRNDTEALRAIDELHELGIAVRFADYPSLDPTSADGRIGISLSFSLARRESMKLSERTAGGLHTKLRHGGWPALAPDGYLNVEERTAKSLKSLEGRYTRWIEIDREQIKVWRTAWSLLLEDSYTLEEICEHLHAQGYTFRSGRAFVQKRPHGKTQYASNGLSRIFHNWFYAGWVVNEKFNIAPKAIHGQWEALLTTEEFERGLEILKKRCSDRAPEHKHFYLLKGLVYLQKDQRLTKLTCSRPNASRQGGGTPYYCATEQSWYCLCSDLDLQITDALQDMQIDPQHLPLLKIVYETEVKYLQRTPADELKKLDLALEMVNQEEARGLRLYTTGKITDVVWQGMWDEWQDRRSSLQHQIDTLSDQGDTILTNLDEAVALLSKVPELYATLSPQQQRELLCLIVERVIVNDEGKILPLRLLPPFAYLHEKDEQVKKILARKGKQTATATCGGRLTPPKRGLKKSSRLISFGDPGGIRTYNQLIKRF